MCPPVDAHGENCVNDIVDLRFNWSKDFRRNWSIIYCVACFLWHTLHYCYKPIVLMLCVISWITSYKCDRMCRNVQTCLVNCLINQLPRWLTGPGDSLSIVIITTCPPHLWPLSHKIPQSLRQRTNTIGFFYLHTFHLPRWHKLPTMAVQIVY